MAAKPGPKYVAQDFSATFTQGIKRALCAANPWLMARGSPNVKEQGANATLLFFTVQPAAGLFDDADSPDHREFLGFTL